jgi:hypothetical protein
MFHLREVIRVHYAHAVCRILQRVTRAKSMWELSPWGFTITCMLPNNGG